MANRLRIFLDRDEPGTVTTEEQAIETSGDFSIEIHNYGTPKHVHVAPVGDLGRFVTFDASNLYFEPEEVRTISASVTDRRPEKFDGKVKIVTGYGTNTTFFDVNLRQQVETTSDVIVDDELAKPQTEEATPSPFASFELGPDTLPVLALAVMAILIAVGATMIATDIAVVVGAGVVLLGVLVALALLIR